MGSETSDLREFDGFRLDANTRVLWHGDTVIALPPKAVDLLIELTGRPGEVVTKDELLDKVWGEAFVEESNLSHNIYLLRKHLTPIGGRDYIETVPKRGYRFFGQVVTVVETSAVTIERRIISQTVIEELDADERGQQKPIAAVAKAGEARRLTPWTAAIAIASITILIMGFWAMSDPKPSSVLDGINKVAVLPIRAEGPVDDSLRFTLSDWLTSRFTSLGAFSVRPASAMTSYDNDLRDPVAIGRRLGLDAILDGSLQMEDGRLRINLQLIDLRRGENLWTGQFTGRAEAMLEIQEEIFSTLAADTGLWSIVNDSGVKRIRPTENIEAYKAYHRGRVLLSDLSGHPSNWDNAVREFETALSLDPQFTLALTGLADVYSRKANAPSFNAREKYYEKASELARRAVSEDPELPEAHISYAWLKRNYEWDFAGSEAHFRKALRLSPDHPEAHRQLSFLLTTLGRHDEAVGHARRAVELAPEQMNHIRSYALILIYARQYDEALRQHEHFFTLYPNNTNDTRYLLWALYALARDNEVITRYEASPAPAQQSFQAKMYYALSVRRARGVDEGNQLIEELAREAQGRIDKKVRFAVILTSLGRFSEALDNLEEGLRLRDDRMVTVFVQPEFEALRGEPRYQAILREMKLME